MAFLTIEGIDVRVVLDSAVETEGLFAGVRTRMRAMNVISTEARRIRVLNCQVDFMSEAEEEAVRAVAPRGQSTTIEGEWPDSTGGEFQGLCDFGNSKPWMGAVNEEGQPIYKTVDLHIEEYILA